MTDTLTQARLKEVVDYNPVTGVWTWRQRSDVRDCWNTKHAGKSAGCISHIVGYLQIRFAGKLYQAHRLAFLYMTGAWPPFDVDHKDLDRANCRWDNLRLATRAQNQANKRTPASNTSGFKGVVRRKGSNVFRAQLAKNGRKFSKEGFSTAEEAYEYYLLLSKIHHGEFARLDGSSINEAEAA